MMNPELLLELSNVADFLRLTFNAIKKVGLEGVDDKSAEWFEKAEFSVRLQIEYLFILKKDAYVSYANKLSKVEEENSKLSYKYLICQGITATIAKMAYLVYGNPNAKVVEYLLEGELGKKGIIEEKIKKDQSRIIAVEWRKFNLAIFEIMDELKEKIEARQKQHKDEKRMKVKEEAKNKKIFKCETPASPVSSVSSNDSALSA